MGEFTKPQHGEICWQELTTSNIEKAKTFYQKMFGWKLEKSGLSAVDYTEIHAGSRAVGGMMQLTDESGEAAEPRWMTYIAVADIDAAVEKIREHGGSVSVEPFEAPKIGKISVVNDPAGTTFSIIQFA